MIYRAIKYIWKQEKSGVSDVRFAEERKNAINSCFEDIESDLSYDYHFVTRSYLKKHATVSFSPSGDYLKIKVETDINF